MKLSSLSPVRNEKGCRQWGYWFTFKEKKCSVRKDALTTLVTAEMQANRHITVNLSFLHRTEQSLGKNIPQLFISCWDISSKYLCKSLYKWIHIVTVFSKVLHYLKAKASGEFISMYHYIIYVCVCITLCLNTFYSSHLFSLKSNTLLFLLALLYYSNQSTFKCRWSFCKIDDLTIFHSYTPFSLWPQQNTRHQKFHSVK